MIPELGRSPGERKGYPLQDSGLENSMDHITHGVAKKLDMREQLSLSLYFPSTLPVPKLYLLLALEIRKPTLDFSSPLLGISAPSLVHLEI